MVNIEKHISRWLSGADEDFAVAKDLVENNRIRHGLFFLHLSLEKTLKARVCSQTNDLAPPIHNLPRLARLAKLALNSSQDNLLADINSFNIEGRYPELFLPLPTRAEADRYLIEVEEMCLWLKSQF